MAEQLLYTRHEAAKKARVSLEIVDRDIKLGRLVAKRPSPRRILIREEDLLEWIDGWEET